MIVSMIKNMYPTILGSTMIVIIALLFSMFLIYTINKLKNNYYNRPITRARYIDHMIDLLNKNKNSDPSLKANIFSTISNLTEKKNKIIIDEIYKPRLEKLKSQHYWNEQKRCKNIWNFFAELRHDNDETFKKMVDPSLTPKHTHRHSSHCHCGCDDDSGSSNPDEVTGSMFTQRRAIHAERFMAVEDIEKRALGEIARRALNADKKEESVWFGLVLGWSTEVNAMVEETRVEAEKLVVNARRNSENVFGVKFLIQERFITEKKVEGLNVVSEALKSGGDRDVNKVMEKFEKTIEVMPTEAVVNKEYEILLKKLR